MTITATMTKALPLDAQLRALASLGSLRPDYLRASITRFDPSDTAGGVRELLPKLRGVGIEPTDAAKYDRLMAVTVALPPEPAGRRLDLSPGDYEQRLRDVAAYHSNYLDTVNNQHNEQQAHQRELWASMRDEADDYLTVLRPAFEHAIGAVRTAIDVGIGLNTSAEDAMDLGPEAVAAWRAMTGPQGTSRVLDSIAGLRIRLSTALGVAPVNTEGGGRPVQYGPVFGGGLTAFDDHQGWRRWLSIAETGAAALLSVEESALAHRRASLE